MSSLKCFLLLMWASLCLISNGSAPGFCGIQHEKTQADSALWVQYLCEMLQSPQFVSALLDKVTVCDSTILSVVPTNKLIKVQFSGIDNALEFFSTALTMSVVFPECCVLLGCCQWVEHKSYFHGEVARYLQYFKRGNLHPEHHQKLCVLLLVTSSITIYVIQMKISSKLMKFCNF